MGQIGAEAMHRLGAGAALTRDELETVVFNVARAAADLKAAGTEGPVPAGADQGGGPSARPFAGLGKETRRTESLGLIASNVCSFGLGVELRGAGAAALEEEEVEPDMGDGCDLLTRESNTLQAALDQLEGGEYALGVYSETRAVDLAAIDGHVRRRSAGFDCCHTVGVKSVCGAEIGGVTVIWKASKLLPVKDYAGRSMVNEIIPGRLLHIRLQVQADNSEFDMLAAYMPAPSASEARRVEIRSCWAVLHETMLRLGDLVLLVGDLNAEPAKAGARRSKPATHRALGDGLLQGLMADLDLRWLGSQRPTYFQAIDSERGGARGSAGEEVLTLALPSAAAPARSALPSRWYERVAEVPLPAVLGDAAALVGRFLLVRMPDVGGEGGWCLALVHAEPREAGDADRRGARWAEGQA